MPIWFEVIALMLVAYGIGLTIGFTLWGRGQVTEVEDTKEERPSLVDMQEANSRSRSFSIQRSFLSNDRIKQCRCKMM